jgi:hypothetical protein
MNPYTFEMRHPRLKREDLRSYIRRIITTECKSDLPGVAEDMIDEALAYYRIAVADHVREETQREAESEISRTRAHEKATIQRLEVALAEVARLRSLMPSSVSVREAEEARLGAFRLAREKAATLVEWPPGCPTNASEEIRAMKEPKPKWTK